MIRFPQAEDTILYTILLCMKGTNDTISASGIHDAFLHDSSLHDISLHEWHEWHDIRKRKTRFFFARCFFARFFFARKARMTRFPQAEYTMLLCTILLCTIFLCTKGTNDTISASGIHDAFLHDSSYTILLCTKGTNDTISASGMHDAFLHDSFLHDSSSHERHDFRKRNTRCFFVSFVHKISCRRPVDIVSFVSFVQEKIVLSTCRHRIIRAIRARKIVLSTCRHRIIRVLRA